MIFLNFKIYPETSGKNTLKLCRLIKSKTVIPCLQVVDIQTIHRLLPRLEIWAQHADPVDQGKFTGWQSPFSLKAAGAKGVIINHAEHQLLPEVIKKTVIFCRQAGLKIMLLAPDLATIKFFNTLKPDFIGFEDPQLIGGPIPMIEAHYDLICRAAKLSRYPLIVGGGIRTGAQVKKSFLAGGQGVLVASEFAKSSAPKTTLADLLDS
ncbi:MAG: triose-phosphate isomerase [Candidatus Beckwithbacteria bacterium]